MNFLSLSKPVLGPQIELPHRYAVYLKIDKVLHVPPNLGAPYELRFSVKGEKDIVKVSKKGSAEMKTELSIETLRHVKALVQEKVDTATIATVLHIDQQTLDKFVEDEKEHDRASPCVETRAKE